MGERLASLGVPVDVAPIAADAARGRSVGRPQIADALVAAGYVATRNDAFDRYLQSGGPAYVPRQGTRPEQVIAIIHGAGGLASLAHPGVSRRDDLLPALAGAGLDAIEARHSDHDPATEARYRSLAREMGMLVTGGSDFHGSDAGHRVTTIGQVTLPREDFEALLAFRARPSR
jgi:predicted metal-dependent phosphoesterase TrpH